MNLPSWRHDPYVEATYTADELKKLTAGLDKLPGLADTGRIVWRMRQLSLRRHPA